jgi:predicted nucleotidyltransferase
MKVAVLSVRDRLRRRRRIYLDTLSAERERLTAEAIKLGVERVILFGSSAQDKAGLYSDLDLLLVWDTPLDILERTAEVYRRLNPRVATDILVYTPDEFAQLLVKSPFVRWVVNEGRVLYAAQSCG